MNVNDETKLEAYVELIAGLQRENKSQSRLIEAQSEMIRSLEEHNECFLQALFGQSCKIFLDIVACPNWTKLQRGDWIQPPAIADII